MSRSHSDAAKHRFDGQHTDVLDVNDCSVHVQVIVPVNTSIHEAQRAAHMQRLQHGTEGYIASSLDEMYCSLGTLNCMQVSLHTLFVKQSLPALVMLYTADMTGPAQYACHLLLWEQANPL